MEDAQHNLSRSSGISNVSKEKKIIRDRVDTTKGSITILTFGKAARYLGGTQFPFSASQAPTFQFGNNSEIFQCDFDYEGDIDMCKNIKTRSGELQRQKRVHTGR